MRGTASPARKSEGLPILSVVPGNVPGATSQRTRPVTQYAPPLGAPTTGVSVHVPPPVTAPDVPPPPAGATNVPVPVSVSVFPLLSLSPGLFWLSLADAWPPGFTVAPGNVRLTMSQRICWA